jgi:homoserine dehydrogenase
MGLQADIRPESVYRQSILGIEPIDFEYAHQLGCTIRQVSMAEIRGKSLFAAVQPMLVPLSSPLSRTKDNQNALIVTGKHGGETVFSGRGAGGGPTAVAVVSDLLALAQNVQFSPARPLQSYRVSSAFSFRYMVRVGPNKGSISRVKETFAKNGIEVDVLRKPKRVKGNGDQAVLVKPSRPSLMERAVRELRELSELGSAPVYLPVFPA